MAGSKTVASVGLTDLKVAPRLRTPGSALWTDVPGVIEATYKGGVTEADQWGDDTLINTLLHSPKGIVSVRATYLAMRAFEELSGNPVTTDGSAEEISIGTLQELIPPQVSLRAIIKNSVDVEGNPSQISFYFYNCTVKTVFENVPEATFGKLSEIVFNFSVRNSRTNEDGELLADPCFGRVILSGPSSPGWYSDGTYDSSEYW